ncbi:MAG TPA: hypothetical protein VHM19_17995 [Polyangiales bacterium]|nr:hypothetical protein [Polyangiales bacterium]
MLRHSAPHPYSGRRAAALFSACACAALCVTGTADRARAEQPGYALELYHAAPHPSDGFTLQLPEAPGHLRWAAETSLDYSRKPLAAAPMIGQSADQSVIHGRLGASVGGALGLGDRAEVWLRLPLVLAQGGDPTRTRGFGFTGLDAAGLGDVSLGGSYDLFGEIAHGLRLGVAANASLPTGTRNALAGDGGLGAGAMALVSYRLGKVTFAGQGGAQLRPESRFGVWTQGSELRFGLGAIFALAPLDLSAELFGASSLVSGQAFSKGSTASEALLGAKLPLLGNLRAGLGFGLGLTQSPGVPAYRVIGSLAWAPATARQQAEANAKAERERAQAETERQRAEQEQRERQRQQLSNAPPAPTPPPAAMIVDGDHDGLLEPADKCPDEAEDRDGYEDDDGCPELDNDRDGVADKDDKCPTSGMTDGVDATGCLLGDGLAGIPAAQRPMTMTFESRTLFRTVKAKKELWRAFKLLQRHPEITLLAIESYADDYDDVRLNPGIAMVRAKRAIDTLTQWGIDPARLRPEIVTEARFDLNIGPGESRGMSGVRFRILEQKP